MIIHVFHFATKLRNPSKLHKIQKRDCEDLAASFQHNVCRHVEACLSPAIGWCRTHHPRTRTLVSQPQMLESIPRLCLWVFFIVKFDFDFDFDFGGFILFFFWLMASNKKKAGFVYCESMCPVVFLICFS
jgi:hypothetical protein